MDLPLLPLLLVLLVALAAGRIASRFGFPSVLGELIAGIVLGPPVLGLLSGHPALDVIAQLGIILMMLYIGMEIDPGELKKASLGGFLAAIGGFITPFALCYFLITWMGGSSLAGLFVGMAAGVTSLATKSRILSDLRLLDTRIAHVMMAGALIADTISLILFAGILGLADAGSMELSTILSALGKATAFFVVAAVVGRYAIPWIGSRLADEGRGTAFAVVLALTLAFAEGAHLAGMHGILGAFIAGMFLRDSVLGRSLKAEIMELVRDVSVRFLAPVFFVTAGFAVSLDVVTETPGLLLGVVGLASIGKIIGTALFYLPTGHGWREGLVIGASMNGRGAVEIIIAQIGLSAGLISSEIFSILVFMAIATTATVPVFLKMGVDWLRGRGELVRSDTERRGTLIIGAGPTARALASALGAGNATLIDRNADHCAAAEAEGLRVFRGDALDERILSEAGASSASTFVPLTGNAEIDALAARQARDTFLIPDVLLPAYGGLTEAHLGSVRHLGATTLFGGPVSTLEWDFRIEKGEVQQVSEPVGQATDVASLTQRLQETGAMLPLAQHGAGVPLPLHSGSRLGTGDHLIVLRTVGPSVSRGLMDDLLRSAPFLDIEGPMDLSEFLRVIAGTLAPQIGMDPAELATRVAAREHRSSTVLERGIAVPHIRLPGSGIVALALARCREGVRFPDEEDPVQAAFVLATTDDRRGDHLRVLASIARLVSGEAFTASWMQAADVETLRQLASDRLLAHGRISRS